MFFSAYWPVMSVKLTVAAGLAEAVAEAAAVSVAVATAEAAGDGEAAVWSCDFGAHPQTSAANAKKQTAR